MPIVTNVSYAYSDQLVGKPPQNMPEVLHKNVWRRLNGSFKNTRTHPDEFIRKIQKGYPYTQNHWRYRHQKNFIQGQILSLDFDRNGAFDTLLEDEFIAHYAYFIYSTPSSTPANPRSRVVFILPKPIKSPEAFTLMATALVNKYDQADSSCKDPARLFYGSPGCTVHKIGNTLPVEVIEKLVVVPQRKTIKSDAVSINCISSQTLNETMQIHLEKIVNAPDGQKHQTRLSVGRLVGGFVSGGYITQQQAEDLLVQAALVNTTAPSLAARDVLDGLKYGLDSPVVITPKRFQDYGIPFPE